MADRVHAGVARTPGVGTPCRCATEESRHSSSPRPNSAAAARGTKPVPRDSDVSYVRAMMTNWPPRSLQTHGNAR